MTEQEARQVVLLQSHEDGGLAWNHPRADARPPLWSADDRAWATHQALAATGLAGSGDHRGSALSATGLADSADRQASASADAADPATPERFVVARAAIALQRLLPRTPAASRWLSGGGWHPAWWWLAVLLGAVAGLAADQLGPPARVALLAPSVWLVVGWNLLVYASLPMPWSAVRRWALRRVAAREQRRASAGSATLWLQLAAPLTLARVSCVLHSAAASLGLGVIASLYVRGLVLDYRIGWESTFLGAAQMQQLLAVLLAPALWLSGQGLPDLAPLRLGPGEAASASAAPWIHLFALTVLLLVVLPRLGLALWAGARARAWRLRFPLALDTPYFQGLHPVMRPGQDHRLRLLCVAAPGVRVPLLLGRPWSELRPWPLDTTGAAAAAGQAWLTSDDGETLWLHGLPEGWSADGPGGPASTTAGPSRPWFSLRRLGQGPAVDPVHQALRRGADAVLLLGPPGTTASAALMALGRPVLVLEDSAHPEAPNLPLRALAEHGVPDWRWLTALDQRLGGDPRLRSLMASWQRRHEGLLTAVAAVLAEALADWASQREPLADSGRFKLGQDDAAVEAAQARLAQAFEQAWPRLAQRLAALPSAQGLPPPVLPDAPDPDAAGAPGQVEGAAANNSPTAATPTPTTALTTAPSQRPVAHHRVKLRTGALLGGVLSGALSGLGADLMTGGLSLGLGTLVGAAAGALGGAGAAKGANVVRGTDLSVVAWPDDALDRFAQAALLQALLSAWGLRPGAAPTLPAPPGAALQAVWALRSPRTPTPESVGRLAAALQPVLLPWLRTALREAQAAGPG